MGKRLVGLLASWKAAFTVLGSVGVSAADAVDGEPEAGAVALRNVRRIQAARDTCKSVQETLLPVIRVKRTAQSRFCGSTSVLLPVLRATPEEKDVELSPEAADLLLRILRPTYKQMQAAYNEYLNKQGSRAGAKTLCQFIADKPALDYMHAAWCSLFPGLQSELLPATELAVMTPESASDAGRRRPTQPPRRQLDWLTKAQLHLPLRAAFAKTSPKGVFHHGDQTPDGDKGMIPQVRDETRNSHGGKREQKDTLQLLHAPNAILSQTHSLQRGIIPQPRSTLWTMIHLRTQNVAALLICCRATLGNRLHDLGILTRLPLHLQPPLFCNVPGSHLNHTRPDLSETTRHILRHLRGSGNQPLGISGTHSHANPI